MAPIQWITGQIEVPAGYARAGYEALHARYIRPAKATDARRRTLEPPARPLLDWLAAQPGGVAVDGVTASAAALADVYGYLAEPCYRLGVPLVVVADRALDELSEPRPPSRGVGYAWSLQRLKHLCAQPSRAGTVAAGTPGPGRARRIAARRGIRARRRRPDHRARGIRQDDRAHRPRRGASRARRAGRADPLHDVQQGRAARAAGAAGGRRPGRRSRADVPQRRPRDPQRLRRAARPTSGTLSLGQWRRLCAIAIECRAPSTSGSSPRSPARW